MKVRSKIFITLAGVVLGLSILVLSLLGVRDYLFYRQVASPIYRWMGIIPGRTTLEYAIQILGQPDLVEQGIVFKIHRYENHTELGWDHVELWSNDLLLGPPMARMQSGRMALIVLWISRRSSQPERFGRYMTWLFTFLKRTLESLSEAIRFCQVCEEDLDEVSQKWGIW
ncbi:MAG: hypothetical protein EHM70_17485 [Chloroflexota bacterium]|nr:MAG: hypothetical protein EHM70_17485 [Chloroflexota bacterium]